MADVIEIHVFDETIEKFLKGQDSAVNTHIAKLAGEVEEKAKQMVPVDTGNLRDHIVVEDDADTFAAKRIGAHVDYAVYVEFGTSKTHAQPYLRPALDAVFGGGA